MNDLSFNQSPPMVANRIKKTIPQMEMASMMALHPVTNTPHSPAKPADENTANQILLAASYFIESTIDAYFGASSTFSPKLIPKIKLKLSSTKT